MLLPAVLLTTALIITVDATHHSPSNNQVVGHQHGQSVAANVGHSKPSDHRLENNNSTKSAKQAGNKQKTEEPELKQCFTRCCSQFRCQPPGNKKTPAGRKNAVHVRAKRAEATCDNCGNPYDPERHQQCPECDICDICFGKYERFLYAKCPNADCDGKPEDYTQCENCSVNYKHAENAKCPYCTDGSESSGRHSQNSDVEVMPEVDTASEAEEESGANEEAGSGDEARK